MGEDDLTAWRLAEKAAVAAEEEVRNAVGKRNPALRELKAQALRLRRSADDLLAQVAQTSGTTNPAPLGETAPAGLDKWVAAWRRAEARAQTSEERLVAAFCRYVEDAGELPAIEWETEVAMLRREATIRLDRVYAEARRLRPRRLGRAE